MQAQTHLSAGDFAAKWRQATTTEKAGSQEHFIDLCRMLGEPTPHEADPSGTSYALEKRVSKAGGGDGFADVWKRGFFPWEYKGKDKDLRAAYGWLNPPGLDPADLEKRTLTNLYNQRPTWLDHGHAALDAAVFAAYGWPTDLPDSQILERLLALNLERAND